MAEIKPLKCPNCGASVHGEGRLACAYCGSALEVVFAKRREEPAAAASDKAPPTDAPPESQAGEHPLPPMAEPRFDGLPDLAVTAATVEIPFDPKVYYNTGVTVPESLKEEARSVLSQLRVLQAAINRGDVDLYFSAVSRDAPAGAFERARAFIAQEFATRRIKRHGRVVSYQTFSRSLATVNVTSEDFLFGGGAGPAAPPAPPGHRLITMEYIFRKEGNAWKLVSSTLASRRRQVMYLILGLIITLGILAGLFAVIGAIVKAAG